MTLLVDDREENGGIFKKLEKEGIAHQKSHLPVGDFVDTDKGIVFERKTVGDFVGSIRSGRLQQQLVNMQNNFDKCYLLISGSFKDLFFNPAFKEFTLEHRLGALASIAVRYNVKMVQVDNDTQLIKLVQKICAKTDDGKVVGAEPIIKRGMGKDDIYLSILCAIPAIGYKRGLDIKEKYPTVKALIAVLDAGNFDVEGIGDKTIEKLKNALCE